MSGLKRNLEAKITLLLTLFPVVLLIGARQTGKTTLSQQLRPDWRYFDLENATDYDFISRDYGFFFREHPRHIIIDEAQEDPELFRHLRGVIDAKREEKGRFILTGSSSPELLQRASDSLAGRIAIVEIGTLKMNEILQQPLPPFYQIFEQPFSADTLAFLKTLENPIPDVIPLFLRGGYPEPVLAQDPYAFSVWMENYYQTYINRDIRRLFPRLDSIRYRRFISMLASLSGTIINKAQLGRSVDVSEVTIRDYIEIADNTYIWRTIPAFETSKSKSVLKMPKGILRDSGLTHYLAGIESREALLRSPQVGQNFEAFTTEEIIKGIQATRATRWDYYYFRTKNGAEVDLVLDGSFGTLPVEIKLGQQTTVKQLTALRQFVEQHELPFGIVVNNNTRVQMLADKIIQIPAGCL
ncbi:MAG TPA: ATP-binding protein [Candidatus Thiothrix moscowensis]|uniref:ATP-binding protein n=1 Tax=unclassified Thiothrix TaxID=2636184 RepID=UPI0025F7CE4C|nr:MULTISPECIES: ATP-binding protein [unclassified Thiothrix]HRJ51423.1 ATP-binding protein [Candidatus Thiothrix moscowensis]HRJ91522.1 ATP-binding protein [Candidatus Thiothrix moscowensis]